jgi:hypothetical protein
MASYLDYLFPPQQQQPVPGLLGEEDIRRNQQMAQRAGLLNTGLGIIAASGPSRMPQGNILQAIAPGLMAGQQAYQGTLTQQQAQLAERAKALQEESIVLPEGGTLVGKRTGKTVAQGAPKLPSGYQNALAALGLPLNILPQDLPPNLQAAIQDQMQKTSGGSNISLSVGTEGAYGKAFAGKIADQDALRYDIASKAPSVLESVDRSRELLKSGNVFTGALATQKLELAKFGQAIGATGKNTDELVSNTQQLMAARAQATLDSIKASGLGSGQGFTDKDRQFLENARLGNITYSKKALEQQLEIEEKAARGSVNAWNSRVKEIAKTAKEPLGVGEIELPKKETKPAGRKVYNPATGRVE